MSKKDIAFFVFIAALTIGIGVGGFAESSIAQLASPGKAMDISNSNALFQEIIGRKGRGAIWKIWAREKTDSSGHKHLRGGLAFRPYASSKRLCRSYVLKLSSPSIWVYGHNVSEGYGSYSYVVSSGLRAAIRKDGKKCSDLSFSSYFRVGRELTDHEIMKLLDYIVPILKHWDSKGSNERKTNVIQINQLMSIEFLKKNGRQVAEFSFNVNGGAVRVFDVKLPLGARSSYTTHLLIP